MVEAMTAVVVAKERTDFQHKNIKGYLKTKMGLIFG